MNTKQFDMVKPYYCSSNIFLCPKNTVLFFHNQIFIFLFGTILFAFFLLPQIIYFYRVLFTAFMTAFLEGYRFGLGTVIFVGPVFFLLLEASLRRGIWAGLAVALGIISSDIVCVVLCYYGLSSFAFFQPYRYGVGLAGSAILLILGVRYLLKKEYEGIPLTKKTDEIKSWGRFFLKGFGINFFNPFVFAVWIGLYQYGQLTFVSDKELRVFLAAVVLGILTLDLIKVFTAQWLKKWGSPRVLFYGYKGIGLLLIGFALRWCYLILGGLPYF